MVCNATCNGSATYHLFYSRTATLSEGCSAISVPRELVVEWPVGVPDREGRVDLNMSGDLFDPCPL